MNKTVFLVGSLLVICIPCNANIKERLRLFFQSNLPEELPGRFEPQHEDADQIQSNEDKKLPEELPGRFEPQREDADQMRFGVMIRCFSVGDGWVLRYFIVDGVSYKEALDQGYFGGKIIPIYRPVKN